MVVSRVRFAIGPVAADVARIWLENSARIVAGARRHRYQLSVTVEEPLLDLVEAYLEFWKDAVDNQKLFNWEADVDPDHVRVIVEQWLLLARLTDDDLAIIDCNWAPPETQPFYDALLSGVISALDQDPDTRPMARQLEVEPPGTPPAER
jgi:hypothetical protein